MRDGFMGLLLNLAWLPPENPLHSRLYDAFLEWGGGSFYMAAPPRNRLKRTIAAWVLRLGGPRALATVLAFFPQSAQRSSLFEAIGPAAGIHCATIRRYSEAARTAGPSQFVSISSGEAAPALL
jgi:hypothetical protein